MFIGSMAEKLIAGLNNVLAKPLNNECQAKTEQDTIKNQWINEPVGYTFVNRQIERRLDYRIRRNLNINVINPSLLKYLFEFELCFTKEFFRGAILETSENTDYRLFDSDAMYKKIDNNETFEVPVYIADIVNPRADFELADSEGKTLHVPNRNEAAEIWGQQLYFNLESTSKYLADAAVEAKEDARDLLNIFARDEYCSSLQNVLISLAWISGSDTEARFSKFDITRLKGTSNSPDKKKMRRAFYKGLPTNFSTPEIVAEKYYCWILQEVNIIDHPNCNLIMQLNEPERMQRIYENVLHIVKLAKEIQDVTYENRKVLRGADDKCEYDVVFEQVCPSINPLIYTRAYAKRRLHPYLDEESIPDEVSPLSILEEYLTHSFVYLTAIRSLIELTIFYAGKETEEANYKARRGIQFLNMLNEAFHSWRIFTFMDIVPDKRYKVRLSTHIHSDANYLLNEIKENRRYSYIKSEILRSGNSSFLNNYFLWRFFLFRAYVRFSAKAFFLWISRGVYQQAIKLCPNSLRYFQRGKGFLRRKNGRFIRRYRSNAPSGFAVEYFLTEDCQTQHLVFDLHGTELEIRPELSFIKNRERVVKKKAFLQLKAEAFERIARRIGNPRRKEWMLLHAHRNKYLKKESYSSLRLPPENFFGRVYLGEGLQYLHQYTTKEINEKKCEYWVRKINRDNTREVILPDGKTRTLAYEEHFRPRPSFVLALRLKHEIRHAFMLMLAALLAIIVATRFLVNGVNQWNPIETPYTLMPTAAGLVATTGLLLMLGLVTFFLTSASKSIFEAHLSRWYRYSFYVAILFQTYLVIDYTRIVINK